MSYESDPLDPENIPSEPIAAAANPGAKRHTAIAIAAVLLVLPIAYLALHRAGSDHVAASAQSAPATAPDIAALEAAVNSNPTASNRINLSLGYINTNAYSRAIPVLQAVLVADPENLLAWNNLCVANTLLQDYASAMDECRHAVQIDPTYQLAKNNLKWASDENQKTIDTLARLEQTAPADRDSRFYLAEGLAFLHTGDNDQAIKAWQRMLDLDPKNAEAANNIGTAYMFKKQPATALQWFQKAADFDPSMQIAKNNMAWAKSELAKSAN